MEMNQAILPHSVSSMESSMPILSTSPTVSMCMTSSCFSAVMLFFSAESMMMIRTQRVGYKR